MGAMLLVILSALMLFPEESIAQQPMQVQKPMGGAEPMGIQPIHIDRCEPRAAAPGEVVTLHGKGFGPSPEKGMKLFYGRGARRQGEVSIDRRLPWSAASIQVRLPAAMAAGTYWLAFYDGGREVSNRLEGLRVAAPQAKAPRPPAAVQPPPPPRQKASPQDEPVQKASPPPVRPAPKQAPPPPPEPKEVAPAPKQEPPPAPKPKKMAPAPKQAPPPPEPKKMAPAPKQEPPPAPEPRKLAPAPDRVAPTPKIRGTVPGPEMDELLSKIKNKAPGPEMDELISQIKDTAPGPEMDELLSKIKSKAPGPEMDELISKLKDTAPGPRRMQPLPDLVPVLTEPMSATVQVKNLGRGPAAPSKLLLGCRWPGWPPRSAGIYRDPAFPGEVVIDVPRLDPGEVFTHELRFWRTLQRELRLESGDRLSFTAKADAGETVAESNEDNNRARSGLTVP